ncbi:MFS general substrate transporter [Limtongia smithiae]|uniref:MFS general substrate transporter n=1 Tax=Limtongia smithiae TaxID=1125753 RepID=UPI0034CF9775
MSSPHHAAVSLDDEEKAENIGSLNFNLFGLEEFEQPASVKHEPTGHVAIPHEGGKQAWLTVAGSSCAMFVSFGWANCIGLFQAEYESNELKDYSTGQVSWITSMSFFFLLFCSPLSGKLFDSYGPRVPILLGSFMHVFGLMMTSLSSKYYQIMLSQSVCSGIGCSLIFTPAMSAPYTYFHKKRAIAGGLTVAGSSLGGVIFPIMVQHLLADIGFPWTMRACAFMILGLLVISNLFIRSAMKHTPKPFHIMDYVRPMTELKFVLICIGSFFLYWGMFVPLDYIVTEAQHYGASTYLALSLVPILNGASFVGRTVPNYFADKVGRFNLMIGMSILSTVLVLGLWLPGRGHSAFICFAVFFGISSGACVGLGPVLIASVSPIKELGTRMGTVFAIASGASLSSAPIAAAIVADDGGSYRFAAVFSGVNFFLATICLCILRGCIAGWAVNANV